MTPPRAKVVVVMPAYNAAATLRRTHDEETPAPSMRVHRSTNPSEIAARRQCEPSRLPSRRRLVAVSLATPSYSNASVHG